MEKRKPNDLPPEQCLAVDTDTLCKLLCCGRHTAVQIGDLANARITMNTRVLWSVQRICYRLNGHNTKQLLIICSRPASLGSSPRISRAAHCRYPPGTCPVSHRF